MIGKFLLSTSAKKAYGWFVKQPQDYLEKWQTNKKDPAFETGASVTIIGRAIDRWALDRMEVGRPVRVQHRSGALWILDSRACALLDVDNCHLPGVERDPHGRATGRLPAPRMHMTCLYCCRPLDAVGRHTDLEAAREAGRRG